MQLKLPELALVLLIGSSGSGKTTFASKHFKESEIISSDYCRKLLADDENDQSVTNEAFEVLHYLTKKRLECGKFTVIDATNVQESARKSLIQIGKEQNCFVYSIVLNLPERVCIERNKQRTDRKLNEYVIKNHIHQLRKSIRDLYKDGFKEVFIFNSEKEINEISIIREPLYSNLKDEHGPFDVIGDVHGCYDELILLLEKLGYFIQDDLVTHPLGRKLIFLGDLVDRGPKIVNVLKLVMKTVNEGHAICVPGNHDIKLLKKLNGKNVLETHGLNETLTQFELVSTEFKDEVRLFIDGLISHYVLDDGKLVVAHAGMKKEYQGRSSGKVREFALYGETTGETDEYGLPERLDWASEYRGRAMVVYGHTPTATVYELNNTYNIDTGCVFGGKLTALRYPEREYADVKALACYYQPTKPFLDIETREDDSLDILDVYGKKIINTELLNNITINEENTVTALEVMSRYSVDPHWLIYLPPTMSPVETSKRDDYLEHPLEAFRYYQERGVQKVVCQQKHMGSRAIIIVCKDQQSAAKRFKVSDQSSGICYTRTGRRFFDDSNIENEFIEQIRKNLNQTNFWADFNTDWVCLDCELMPWSNKALSLLKNQYAPVGVAGINATNMAVELIRQANHYPYSINEVQASNQTLDLNQLLKIYSKKNEHLNRYVEAYHRYCWNVNSFSDFKLAPFHILATEGSVHTDKNHIWHLDTIKNYVVDEQVVISTKHIVVDVSDENSLNEGIKWWEELTQAGGEGMVVKPFDFIVKNSELIQPAVKCRGKEYLRIIYGPEYTTKENLMILKKRSLGKKRTLALREFALGVEALERFVSKEALYRYHECVFGVLALESEPIDPRL